MGSGNFLVGDGLKMSSFRDYVVPLLANQGISVDNCLSIFDVGPRILVSLVGTGDLEAVLNSELVELGKRIETDLKDSYKTSPHQPPNLWSNQISASTWVNKEPVRNGIYEVIGIYSDIQTASKLFPMIAQQYLLDQNSKKFDEFNEQLVEFCQKLTE